MNVIDASALPANMQAKIRIDGSCWVWTGARNRKGYGSVSNGKNGSMLAHRKAYEAAYGPIAEGMTIDHICEVKACVNPAHLQQMTRTLNVEMRGVRAEARLRATNPVAEGPHLNPLYDLLQAIRARRAAS